MTDNKPKSDIVDTTDCLEAVNTFKAAKNFLFIVILICLILVQAIFWANKLGFVSEDTCSSVGAAQSDKTDLELPKEESTPPVVDEAVKKAAAAVTAQPAPVNDVPDEATALVIDGVATEDAPARKGPSIPKPRACCLAIVVKVCNFILVIAATLYSLTLLMSIKISLCGRLGGLSHISKAFFTSLFALVILMPWQALLPGVLVGAIYTPAELFTPAECLSVPPVVGEILYYFRFSGMWLVVTLLLISSQSRSMKWAKTILKRLGILH